VLRLAALFSAYYNLLARAAFAWRQLARAQRYGTTTLFRRAGAAPAAAVMAGATRWRRCCPKGKLQWAASGGAFGRGRRINKRMNA